MTEQKDFWDMLSVIGTLASGILIPGVLFFLGWQFNRKREQNASEERGADRIALLLKHLASENPRERLLAVKVAQHLSENNLLPSELIPALAAIAVTDDYSGSVASDALNSVSNLKIDRDLYRKELLEPLVGYFDKSKAALSSYFQSGRKYSSVKEMATANTQARNLLVGKALQIPPDLREHANRLVTHYGSWLSGFRAALSAKPMEPEDSDAFEYLAAPRHPYPKESENAFREDFQDTGQAV